MKDNVIIGSISGYSADKCDIWLASIGKSGFPGDVVLVATNTTAETVKALRKRGAIVVPGAAVCECGNIFAVHDVAPHVHRFKLISNYLKNNSQYGIALVTDVRDVAFQSDPIPWIKQKIGCKKIVCSSEQVKYIEEPWNRDNIAQAFDPDVSQRILTKTVYNVGVLGGAAEYIGDLTRHIYEISANRAFKITDQAVFNYLVHTTPYRDQCLFSEPRDGWAIQLGTVPETLKGGWGSFPHYYRNHPEELHALELENPLLIDNIICNKDEVPFCVVHQYDRVPHFHSVMVDRFSSS